MPLQPSSYGREQYEAMTVMHRGTPAMPGDDVPPVTGPYALVGMHMTNDDDEFMLGMVRPCEQICDRLRERLSKVLLVKQDGIPSPPSLLAHPHVCEFGNYDVVSPAWAEALSGQRRIIMAGWDARACVSQLLSYVTHWLPKDERCEFHFPLGALDDAQLDDADRNHAMSLSLLLRMYAERIGGIRRAVDVKFNEEYLGRHGSADASTVMRLYSSTQEFLRLCKEEVPSL